jgi:[acyl-carrier-protein] S-malonyltransferase
MNGHVLTQTAGVVRPDAGRASRPAPVVFLFPGQSSVDPSLLVRARRSHPAAQRVVESAHRVLGLRRASEYFDPHGAPRRSNRDVQVAVFLATQMYLAGLTAEGVQASASAGLSLGEYSHLVDIGALTLDDALALVDERGRCYDEAPDGTMLTVLAVDHDTVADIVAQAQARGAVVISNYNAPTQHVLAGDRETVAWAAQTLEDEHAAHTTLIEDRVPMHSPLMTAVARAFEPAVRRAPWRTPTRAYWPNVTGAPMADATADDLVTSLLRHVSEPVRWRAAVDTLAAAYPGATFLEVGPGRVLHNMLSRGWKGTASARVDALDDADPHAHFLSTIEAVRAGA